MLVSYKYKGEDIKIQKGALDVLLPDCTEYWNGKCEENINVEKKQQIFKTSEKMATAMKDLKNFT